MFTILTFRLQMDCIPIPLLRGSLDDAVRQGDSETNTTSTSLILERENQ